MVPLDIKCENLTSKEFIPKLSAFIENVGVVSVAVTILILIIIHWNVEKTILPGIVIPGSVLTDLQIINQVYKIVLMRAVCVAARSATV